MAIAEDIAVWARSRPRWQQEVLRDVALGKVFTQEDLGAILNAVMSEAKSSGPAKPLDLALATADPATVTIGSLQDCKGINALTDEEELHFAPTGLTIVYGDNGSGKSGYARIVKGAVGARHAAHVLPDVFEDRPDEPSAVLRFGVDGDMHELKVPGPADPVVRQMHFYDEHCGDAYLARKSAITYRPSALVLLDGLIDVCDRLRTVLADRLRDNETRAMNLNFPEGTVAARFVLSLTATTSAEAVESATTLASDAHARRARAITEVARLRAGDAFAEQRRLEAAAQAAASLATILAACEHEVGVDQLAVAQSELDTARARRGAAELAATGVFEGELPGVGGEPWRVLWDAARRYATTDAYKDEHFPVVHPAARCPLCQQILGAEARDRFARFDRHMRDTTERDAVAAERIVTARIQRIESLDVGPSSGIAHLGVLRDLGLDSLVARTTALLDVGAQMAQTWAAWLKGDVALPATGFDASETRAELVERAASLSEEGRTIDVVSFQSSLAAAQAELSEVESHVQLCQSRSLLLAEVARLAERERLETTRARLSTTSITAKSTQLTRVYAGDVIRNEFVRETERLRLRRVTMRDLGGSKGRLQHQPALDGAKARDVQVSQVLSEGEQSAMGLAGFFTEASFDPTKSALILDDPVNSLDHRRRTYVASRLVEFAATRQVVVFTHDVTFAGALMQIATKEAVAVAQRSVERKGEIPGFVRATLPWKAKDFAARCAQLEVELRRLSKQRAELGQDDWDKAVGSWAGDLSELWESCVNSEILDEVYDRGTAQVRVLKFRILSAVTAQDDAEFQAGYAACSTWARRHNKGQETNYVAPEPDEMTTELDRIKAWQKRVKAYRN